MNNLSFLHLTDDDLDFRSKRKPFEKITIHDFDYCINEAVKAHYVFFIDGRKTKALWKKVFGLNGHRRKRVKRLKP
jgi:hypothetical protein